MKFSGEILLFKLSLREHIKKQQKYITGIDSEEKK